MAHFSTLGISNKLIKALSDLKISTPTEIQNKAIPILINEKSDFVGLAKTGTGKTAAFCLPLLMKISIEDASVQAVILVPTRELGQQIYTNLESFSKYMPEVLTVLISGGSPLKPQIAKVESGAHIIIATPGRLIDLIKRKAIDLSKTKLLILDEADEMVTALKEGLEEITPHIPSTRSTWLFSATMPGGIKQLIQKYMKQPVQEIIIDPEISINQGIRHEYVVVEPEEKLDVLLHFLNQREGKRGIIFCNTKAAVNKLAKNLAINRFSSGALHGSFTQPVRDKIMDQFRNGHIQLLVATDVAARGIDLQDISFVIHYHLPDVNEVYIHRSGRTARAGATGLSLTVIQPDELSALQEMERSLGINIKPLTKPGKGSIEENKVYLWTKQVFRTKPNHQLEPAVRESIKELLKNLSKDELIDKLIAHYLLQNKSNERSKSTTFNKKKKKS